MDEDKSCACNRYAMGLVRFLHVVMVRSDTAIEIDGRYAYVAMNWTSKRNRQEPVKGP